jgi:hypothetical protein
MRPIATLFAAALLACVVACDSKVTAENFEKIQVGMTMGQVQGILGKGEVQDVSGMNISGGGVASRSGPSSLVTWTWREGNIDMSVTFENGKVVSKAMR